MKLSWTTWSSRTKKLIKEQGNPRPGSLLLKEVPQTELDIFEASGGTGALAQGRESFPSVAVKFPKDSEERKVGHGEVSPNLGGPMEKEVDHHGDPILGIGSKAWAIGSAGAVHQALWPGG